MAAANSLRRHHAKLSPLRRAGGPCLSGKLAQGRLRTKEAAICEERRGATVSWERRRRARCAPRTDLFGRPFVLARRWAGLMQRRIEMLALHVADNPINGAIAALWHGRPGARQLPSESRRDRQRPRRGQHDVHLAVGQFQRRHVPRRFASSKSRSARSRLAAAAVKSRSQSRSTACARVVGYFDCGGGEISATKSQMMCATGCFGSPALLAGVCWTYLTCNRSHRPRSFKI